MRFTTASSLTRTLTAELINNMELGDAVAFVDWLASYSRELAVQFEHDPAPDVIAPRNGFGEHTPFPNDPFYDAMCKEEGIEVFYSVRKDPNAPEGAEFADEFFVPGPGVEAHPIGEVAPDA